MRLLPTHPRTGLAAVGLRRDGRPIWPIRGGAPNAVLQRLVDERESVNRQIDDILKAVEDDERDPTDSENELLGRHRDRLKTLDDQINPMADLEEARGAGRDVRKLLSRGNGDKADPSGTIVDKDPDKPEAMRVFRMRQPTRDYQESPWPTFSHYARDLLVQRYDPIMRSAGGPHIRDEATERLTRAPVHTLTTDVAGLLPGTHMAQIMDVIDTTRPLVASARAVPLDNGKLTYPKITSRPRVTKQTTQKTEQDAPGSQKLGVSMESMSADTYLGAGNLSWQTINWTSPAALQLWFDLCAEDYARQTEAAAAVDLNTSVTESVEIPLADGDTLAGWWAGIIAAAQAVYNATGGRVVPNTIWASPSRFFQLLGLMAPSGETPAFTGAGAIDLTTLRGNVAGLTLIGTFGLPTDTIIEGDARALLVGEQSGTPVDLRAVEPSIGGMEVGLIGAFKSKVFDITRFAKITVAAV